MDQETEIPQYFLCPISLQILKDPVTTITGITYDRKSIEQWLFTAKGNPTCPLTKKPLPRDSPLIPNHTLKRLIHSWCTQNAMQAPSSILGSSQIDDLTKKTIFLELVKDLDDPSSCSEGLKKMEELVLSGNERNKKLMVESGAARGVIGFIVKCSQEKKSLIGLEESLRILDLVWSELDNEIIKNLVKDNYDLINSLTWVLQTTHMDDLMTMTNTLSLLKKISKVASPSLLERLKLDFFKEMVKILHEKPSQQTIKFALLILLEVCSWGRNRMKIVEAEAVFYLIELELQLEKPGRSTTELIFHLLAQLCSCADGRGRFLMHAGGVAMVSKRILRVSPTTDDRAVNILDLVAKFSATNEVVVEMLRVGAVTKLCMVMQANCAPYLKKKARGILRLHSSVWSNSPCIAVYLLTWYPR